MPLIFEGLIAQFTGKASQLTDIQFLQCPIRIHLT